MLGLVALLFCGNAVVTRLGLLPVWQAYALPVLLISLVVLLLSIFQNDSPASLTDDWLCRPVARGDLLAAKLLLVLSATYLPSAAGAFAADLGRGSPLAEALLDAVLIRDELLVCLLPLLLFTAITTRTLVQGFGVLIAVLIAVFVIPTPFVREPGPLDPGIREALPVSGMGWLATAPVEIAALGLAGSGCGLGYWRRQLAGARARMGLAVAASLALALAPMALLPWASTFSLQKALGPVVAAETPRITLRQTRACFPATHRSELMSDAAFAAAMKASDLRLWEEDALDGVAADSVAFITQVEPRGLPSEWRVKLNYVQARYSTGEKIGVALRPARYFNDPAGSGPLTHAWMLPGGLVRRLTAGPVQLALTYSLTVLKPREHHLATDGKRHALPGLGYCSAVVDEPYDRIEVECFGGVSSPAQISAQLNRIPASRVYGPADFAPAWARWPYSHRAELTLSSPRLAAHETITVTAWDVAGYVDSSLTAPGILGADLASCPLPSSESGGYQSIRWRDAAPHETRQVNVGDGVQIEVLDFGGTGSPILLLPGLGATAHSYDDVAPRLARDHRVVAMTRRGAGYSSRPDFGFETPRLAQDVIDVMHAMELDRVLLVGHSIAGEELTWLGGHEPGRFTGLVYLDAAYDRASDRDSREMQRLRALDRSLPPEAPIPPEALRDYAAMSGLLVSRGHERYPEGELMAFFHANSPFIAGTPAIDARTQQAITAAIQPPDYRRVKIPALAVYAIPDPEKPLPTWYGAEDAQLRATVAEIAKIKDTLRRKNIERFRREVEKGRVVEMRNATHAIVQSNPDEVVSLIESFSTAQAVLLGHLGHR